jgi:integrase
MPRRRRRRARGSVIRYDGVRGVVWRIKYVAGDGRPVMETLGRERDGWDRARAEDALEERLIAVRQREYRPPKPVTFAAWADDWFRQGELTLGWKPRTVTAYRTVVARLTHHLGTKRLAAIRPRDVSAYVKRHAESGKLGPATLSRDLSILHAIFEAARREELVETNPADNAQRPKLPPFRPRVLKPAEIQGIVRELERFARAAGQAEQDAAAPADVAWHRGDRLRWEQAGVVFLTLVLTGLRRFELQSLRWRDVDLVENVLRVEDSKSEDGRRSIAIPPSLADALAEQLGRTAFKGDDELVFAHPEKGTMLRVEQWQPLLDKARAAAGVNGRLRPFHDLRHTAITNDAASGASPIAVKAKAGHASFKTTERYIHLAGVVFHDEAQRLEERILGRRFYQPSTNMREPHAIEGDPAARNGADGQLIDAAL